MDEDCNYYLPQFLALNADPRRDTSYDAWKADWSRFRWSITTCHGVQFWDDLCNKFDNEYTQHGEWTVDGWK